MSSKKYSKVIKHEPTTGENLLQFQSDNDDKSGKPRSHDEIDNQSIISPNLHFGLTVFIVAIQLGMVLVRVISPDHEHVDNSFRKFETLCKARKLDLSGCFEELLKVDFVAKVEKLTKLAEGANSRASQSLSVAEEAKLTAKYVKSELETVRSNVAIAGAAKESADKALITAEEAKSEAKRTADSVDAKAENANRTAQAALTTAQGAEKKAAAALEKAENADSKAGVAQQNAATALEKAESALTNALKAQQIAETALTNAVKAQQIAETALTNSVKAQQIAGTALEKAQTALTNAGNAQNTANTALSSAESAHETANNNEKKLENLKQTSQTRYDEFKKYQSDMESKQDRSHFKMSVSEELIDQLRNKEVLYDAGLYLSLFSIFCVVMLTVLVLRKGNIQQDRTAHAVQGRSVPRPLDQEDKYKLKWQGPMENSVCVVSFHSETERLHARETRSVFESVGKSVPQIHSKVVRQHSDIQDLPGSKVFFVFVDFNERNVILEDPAKGLGNLRVTTVRSLWKFGADVTVIYCKDQGSRNLDADLFNRDLTSIFSHPELSTLKNEDRMLSIFDELTDRQKQHCREIINKKLKRA